MSEAASKAPRAKAPVVEPEGVEYISIFFDRPRRIGNKTVQAISGRPADPLLRITEGGYTFFRVPSDKGYVEVPANNVASALRVKA